MASVEPIYELKCSCNSYPWGKQGAESLSARLCAKEPGWIDPNDLSKPFEIKDEPFAEMWMGTYPVLPSYLASTGEDLQNVLDTHAEALIGKPVLEKFGHSKLPFLPKVLSIAKALPLQLHPNKELAARLHEKNPDQFTDANHKPEIALALGEFEAFCGFKPLASIHALMQLEPLKRYLPQIGKPEFDDQQLKGVVKKMLEADDASVKETYDALTLLPRDAFGSEEQHIQKLAPRLAEQYSAADPGLLVALITMNYMVLQRGESIYIPADGIHAYLSGDIIECMARSNNVLNTGFCPRSDRDNIDLFISCLTFTPHSAEEALLKPTAYERGREGKTERFSPPLSEFDMLQTTLKAGEKEMLGSVKGPGILLVTEGGAEMKANGKAMEVGEGQCFFVAQGTELEFEAGKAGALVHLAYVE
ncbi:hypothetical protein LTR53_017658 [Teratosphaeriaceae sp. CCFEE 6253]|nr:hypothetical protein LTR53_017658 [Teratosphaeriaceae sp. CCFEE 6253]